MPSEWRGVGALWIGQPEIGNTTPKSPRFTRDFAWIVSAHVGFSVCSACHMSIADNTRWSSPSVFLGALLWVAALRSIPPQERSF